MAVAQNAKLIALCARVLPEGSDGSGVSRRECEVSLTSRAGGASYGGAGAALLLFAMGYDENDIRRVYPMHPETPRFDQFLLSLEQTDEIRDRLTRLPDFSKGDRTGASKFRPRSPGASEPVSHWAVRSSPVGFCETLATLTGASSACRADSIASLV